MIGIALDFDVALAHALLRSTASQIRAMSHGRDDLLRVAKLLRSGPFKPPVYCQTSGLSKFHIYS